MLAQIIALFAAAAAPAVTSQASGEEIVAPWPSAGVHSGLDGHVVLQCLVDTHGLAETCQIASEEPAGRNLGRAALGLRATLKLKPAAGPDGQAVNAVMAINVRFKAQTHEFDTQEMARQLSTSGSKGFGTLNVPQNDSPIPAGEDARIDYPIWAKAATFEDLAAAYPAKGAGVEGYAAAHCRIERDGDKAGLLRDCAVLKEIPGDHGFGKAAVGLAAKFRIEPATLANLPRGAPIFVNLPIRLTAPGAADPRIIDAPQWLVGLDPKTVQKMFPPEAAAQGLKTGRGVARCTVGVDGMLTACAAEPGEPNGQGFSEAAVKLVSSMKMNLWSADGAPVQGGVIHIPIRLNLKGG